MKLGILGINKISEVAIEIAKENYSKCFIALFDDNLVKRNKKHYGYSVIGNYADVRLAYENKDIDNVVICYGDKYLKKKKKTYEEFTKLNIPQPKFVHHSVIASKTAKVGYGTIISFGVILGHNVKIGNGIIIWSGAVIEHDSKIGAFSFISPNVTVCGMVKIGECSFVGAGATILPNVIIGNNCVV